MPFARYGNTISYELSAVGGEAFYDTDNIAISKTHIYYKWSEQGLPPPFFAILMYLQYSPAQQSANELIC